MESEREGPKPSAARQFFLSQEQKEISRQVGVEKPCYSVLQRGVGHEERKRLAAPLDNQAAREIAVSKSGFASDAASASDSRSIELGLSLSNPSVESICVLQNVSSSGGEGGDNSRDAAEAVWGQECTGRSNDCVRHVDSAQEKDVHSAPLQQVLSERGYREVEFGDGGGVRRGGEVGAPLGGDVGALAERMNNNVNQSEFGHGSTLAMAQNLPSPSPKRPEARFEVGPGGGAAAPTMLMSDLTPQVPSRREDASGADWVEFAPSSSPPSTLLTEGLTSRESSHGSTKTEDCQVGNLRALSLDLFQNHISASRPDNPSLGVAASRRPPASNSGSQEITRESLLAIGVTDHNEQNKILGITPSASAGTDTLPSAPPLSQDTPSNSRRSSGSVPAVEQWTLPDTTSRRFGVPSVEQLIAIGISDPREQADILRSAGLARGVAEDGMENLIRVALNQIGHEGGQQSASGRTAVRHHGGPMSAGHHGGPVSAGVANQEPLSYKNIPDDLGDQVTVNMDIPVSWGSFKSAYDGKFKGMDVSVLLFRASLFDREVARAACSEVAILRKLPLHDRIISYHGCIFKPDKGICLVMERCSHGQLDLFLSEHSQKVSDDHRLSILAQICGGMRHVAKAGIIHRDLSAHNIMISSVAPLSIKIIDFGLAMLMTCTNEGARLNMEDVVGIRWTAVEIFKTPKGGKVPWSEMTDVWAFGVTAWQVWTNGEVPYTLAMTDPAVRVHVTKGRSLGCPYGCPRDVYESVLQDCWIPDPENRPSFDILFERLYALQKKYQG